MAAPLLAVSFTICVLICKVDFISTQEVFYFTWQISSSTKLHHDENVLARQPAKCHWKSYAVFLMGHPRPLFHLFSSFQTHITILTTTRCGKMLCPSSIWHRDLNPRPSEHESPPITTRPGLPPDLAVFYGAVTLYFFSVNQWQILTFKFTHKFPTVWL